jgi:hypothetical protein
MELSRAPSSPQGKSAQSYAPQLWGVHAYVCLYQEAAPEAAT